MYIKRPKNKKECLKGQRIVNCGDCKDYADCKGIKAQTNPYQDIKRCI